MRRIGAVAVLFAVIALLGGACSSSSNEADPSSTSVGPQNTLPKATGYDCADPTGDIGMVAPGPSQDLTGAGALSQPDGIDITSAVAKLTDTDLTITYTMVGPIAPVAEPFFDMLQGDASAPAVSFDLRTEPSGPGGAWVLSVGTTPAGIGQETFKPLPQVPTVQGNTLTYTVPLTSIPPIATLQWTFGVTSTDAAGNVFYDDCSSIPSPTASGSTTTTAG